MKKRYLVLFYLFTIIFSLISQDKIYWDSIKTVTKGDIGKIEVINNATILGLGYSENSSNQHKILFQYALEDFRFNAPILFVDNFYSNNPQGVDFNIKIDKENNIYLIYRTNPKTLVLEKLYYSDLYQGKKEKIFEINSENIIYLPLLFIDKNNSINIFYTENINNDDRLKYKKISTRGEIQLETTIAENYNSTINPYIQEYNNNFYLAFQGKSQSYQGGLFYNIILAISGNNGQSWEYRDLVTAQEKQHNQRPSFIIEENKLHLVFEKDDASFTAHIHYKRFDIYSWNDEGDIQISDINSEAHYPSIISDSNSLNIFWYDNLNGYFQNYHTKIIDKKNQKNEMLFEKKERTIMNSVTLFNNILSFFWLQKEDKNDTIYFVKTDSEVSPPEIFSRDMVKQGDNYFTNKLSVRLSWTEPQDISGIRGYRYTLTQNENDTMSSLETMISKDKKSYQTEYLNDGVWYFKIKAYDNAGNESKEALYSFTLKTTPPEPPGIIDPETDAEGFLTNNLPVIKWENINGDLVKYKFYSRLFYTDDNFQIEELKDKINFDALPETQALFYDFKNNNQGELDNGTLLVGIQGIDILGNKSSVNWQTYQLNKFKTTTYISSINLETLNNGQKVLVITGRGFQKDGTVSKIYISKDKNPPYQYTITPDNFIVVNDRVIRQLTEFYIEEGSYYIGLEHPVRGIIFDDSKSTFSSQWTFKYEGNKQIITEKIRLFFNEFNLTKIILLMLAIFFIIIFFILTLSIIKTAQDRVYIKNMLQQLEKMKQEMATQYYEERREAMIKKGLGLTIKYTFLILTLVIFIVSVTAFTISVYALGNERMNLANEMKERAKLVMTNYETTIKDIFIVEKGITEVGDATTNISKLPDIGFALFGQKELDVPIMRLGEKKETFFKNIPEANILDNIINNVVKNEIDQFRANYKTKEISEIILPAFDPANLQNKYVFIRPIILYDKDKNPTYIGEIMVGYSFQKILETIQLESYNLIRTALLITLIAILVSIVGAIFLAATTIRPIKRISKHVELITSKEDYEDLVVGGNDRIEIKSKDEIGILASAINEMTHKLIEKAKADKQLLLGKEIQKKFIPLEPLESEHIDIYGFYEGAKGVSGDYFDFKKLDNDYYAMIICDVSGKAVPAALIMVQISTIFHSYFTNYKINKSKIDTVEIVNRINDTVEERGFQGRFAAILVMIMNVKTGETFLTNAGYTQLLVFRDNKNEAEWLSLFQSGAAGAFPSYMLPEPFQQEKIMVNRGDIVFLFTDGFEESRSGKKTVDEKGEEHFEEFGLGRVKKVLDKSKGKTPKEVIMELTSTEKSFRGNNEQYDDLTIIGIKRK